MGTALAVSRRRRSHSYLHWHSRYECKMERKERICVIRATQRRLNCGHSSVESTSPLVDSGAARSSGVVEGRVIY